MAGGANVRQWAELEQAPLGSRHGENLGVPVNYVIPPARIYVKNYSRTLSRKEIAVAVSARRGAEEALAYNNGELMKTYNVDTLIKRIESGVDMNRYTTHIHPVAFVVIVDGQATVIPPAVNAETEPPEVEVPDGAWDVFLGNYDRMRGVVRDPLEHGKVKREGDKIVIGEEQSRLNLRWSMRFNPVLSYVDDGDVHEIKNPYGYLQFIRRPVRAIKEIMDKDYLSALELVEA